MRTQALRLSTSRVQQLSLVMMLNYDLMKIPRSGASRLSVDVWIIGEALSRFHRTDNIRTAIESEIRKASDNLIKISPEYAEVLQEVKNEGLEDD